MNIAMKNKLIKRWKTDIREWKGYIRESDLDIKYQNKVINIYLDTLELVSSNKELKKYYKDAYTTASNELVRLTGVRQLEVDELERAQDELEYIKEDELVAGISLPKIEVHLSKPMYSKVEFKV